MTCLPNTDMVCASKSVRPVLGRVTVCEGCGALRKRSIRSGAVSMVSGCHGSEPAALMARARRIVRATSRPR